MKLDSKYFDTIRIKPDEERLMRDRVPECDWPGCSRPAPYPAPKGRSHEGEYHQFCLEHVRTYNKSYNYFTGLAGEAVDQFREQATTGHRPTWRMGTNGWAHISGGRRERPRSGGYRHSRPFEDPFDLFEGDDTTQTETAPRRAVRNAERKALDTLGLDETATAESVRAQYKRLVKRHHPDANGGSREGEDRLIEIIQAYDYLKSAGFC
ncbi:DnaJ domain-containing protein [Kaustia mangrovi]|uniref:DnaJ domain-containing protein n=1 Tax=Kaustia mangrovi TaxID=2593653 RepID=A0A7S8HBQ1_9HYPH|nr:J domain-containing protein [Kaustia mangrovi]QPC42433.1 DnaJ domain-containing protein [Kaustia mangrovi]